MSATVREVTVELGWRVDEKTSGARGWRQLLWWAAVCALVALATGCGEPLHHGLDETEANAMVVVLEQEGIEAEKVRDPQDGDRWAVEVPSGQRVEAWSVLQKEGFPRPEAGGFDDFYPGGGLIPTAKEERVVLQYATARELQTSLLRIDGIVDAHVHLVLPEKPRVQMSGEEGAEPRASVLVQWRRRGDDDVAPIDKTGVRQLVSGAVEDLDKESVHVVKTAVDAPQRPVVETRTAQVGPIAVAEESETALKGLVLLMAGVIVALSGGLVFMVVTYRRARGDEEVV